MFGREIRPGLYIIHGRPGSGKTRTAISLAVDLLAVNSKATSAFVSVLEPPIKVREMALSAANFVVTTSSPMAEINNEARALVDRLHTCAKFDLSGIEGLKAHDIIFIDDAEYLNEEDIAKKLRGLAKKRGMAIVITCVSEGPERPCLAQREALKLAFVDQACSKVGGMRVVTRAGCPIALRWLYEEMAEREIRKWKSKGKPS